MAAGGLWTPLSSACEVQREEEDSPRRPGGMGPQLELITQTSVSLPFVSFLMEKQQHLSKIYLGTVCKVNCSLQKAAIHSAAWHFCEVPVSICFPHACGAVNLAAHKGRNFQAEGCQGSAFNTQQDLLGQVTLATTKSSIVFEASGNAYFARSKFRLPWTVQCSV